MSDVEMFSHQDAFGGHVAGVRPKQSPDDVAKALGLEPDSESPTYSALRRDYPDAWYPYKRGLVVAAEEKDKIITKLVRQLDAKDDTIETQAQKLEWYEERFKVQATHIHKNTVIATPGLQEEIDRLRDALSKVLLFTTLLAIFTFCVGFFTGAWLL